MLFPRIDEPLLTSVKSQVALFRYSREHVCLSENKANSLTCSVFQKFEVTFRLRKSELSFSALRKDIPQKGNVACRCILDANCSYC